MPNLGAGYIQVRADDKKLSGDLKKAEGKFKTSATSMQSSVNRINFSAVTAAAVAFGVAATVAFNKSIKAASDLEETTSKFNVVFKGQAKIANQWAQTIVESYGLSTREARQYMASVQDLLVPMGMQADSAARLSNEIVKLSVDLGSFNNLPTEQVMLDIQSALVGNFETMKKYGVVINATRVQQQAMNMGLAETKDALTAADKAQAAYALIVEGSEAAIGDLERTSDGYANTSKRLSARLEDLAAVAGEKFLPIMRDIKSVTADAVSFITDFLRATDPLLGRLQQLEGFFEQAQRGQKRGAFFRSLFGVEDGAGAQKVIADTRREMEQLFYLIDRNLGVPGSIGGGTSGGSSGTTETIPGRRAFGSDGIDLIEQAAQAETDRQNAIIEAERAAYDQRLQVEYEFWQAKYDGQAAWLNAETALENESIRREQQAMQQKKNIQMQTIKNFGYALQIAGQYQKWAFDAYKVYAVAEATVSGLESVVHAFNWGTKLGGPPLGAAFAASAAAVTAAQIGAIASAQYSGGGASISAGGGGAVGVYPANPTTGVPEFNQPDEKRGTLIINIEGDFVGDENYIDNLVEKINQAKDERDVTVNYL